MKKNKKLFYNDYFLSIFITLIILLFLSVSLGFIGMFSKNFVIGDFYEQYIGLLNNLKNNGIELFSFNKGLGGPMIGTIAYYLISPFNLIIYLFNSSNLHIACMLIVYLKIIFSSFTMCFYLKYNFKNKKHLYIFSVCYVFMNFICTYFFNIMWLDILYLLPLTMYGIDKLIKEKKSIYYIIFLSLSILSNYLMGYILCIFSVIYFIYKMIINNKIKDFKIIKKFIISSILGGLLTSFITIPTILEIPNYSRMGYEPNYEFNNNILMFIADLFIGSHDYINIICKDKISIFCSIFCFILTIFYFINKKIDKKNKIASLVIILIFILSMVSYNIYLIWHAFSPPHGLAGRFTFLISFFMILLSVESFSKIKYLSKRDYYIVAPILPILGVIVMFGNFTYLETYKIYLSVIFYILYLLFLYQSKNNKKLITLILLLVVAEVSINFYLSVDDFIFNYNKQTKTDYIVEKKEIDKIKKDKNFYRIEKDYAISFNDPLLYDYKSVGLFLSTSSDNQTKFLNNNGYITNNVLSYSGRSLPVSSSVLGVKYLLAKNENQYYEKIDTFKRSGVEGLLYDLTKIDISIYKNNNSLNLGVATTKDVSKCILKENDVFTYQNNMVSCLYGEDLNLYNKLKIKQKGETYKVDVKDSDIVYFYPKLETENSIVTGYIENNLIGEFSDLVRPIQLFDNKENKLKNLNVKLVSNDDTKLYAYSFDKVKYNKIFSELKENELILEKEKSGYIKASIDVDKDKKYVYTTIPYDKGWTVYVDGKKTSYDKVFDTFIGLNIKDGKHIIEFKYFPRGLYLGIFITIISLCTTYVYMKKEKN